MTTDEPNDDTLDDLAAEAEAGYDPDRLTARPRALYPPTDPEPNVHTHDYAAGGAVPVGQALPHDETFRALDAMARNPHAPDDRVSRDAVDWTHPRLREPDDDMPDILTPLDRIHPLTGRPRDVIRESTVTARADLTGPSVSDAPTRLSFEDVHFDQDTALELLNDAADMIRRALHTEPATSAVLHEAAKRWETDGAAWLARFTELGR